jgi:signal transduction histidine kinase
VSVRIARHMRGAAPAYGVLLISLCLTALAYYYVCENVEEQARVRFGEAAMAAQEAIERRVEDYLDAMFGVRGLYYASDSVSSGEWDNYVRGIQPHSHFQGLQALTYLRRVRPEEMETFERSAREEGLPGLRPDLDPGGERSAYFPAVLVGPLNEANRDALGYDYYAEAAHRAAMDRARDSGSPQATRMLFVLTDAPEHSNADLALRKGFYVYLPVYREGMAHRTVSERRRALEGFVMGSFVIDGLLGGVFGGSFKPAIDFEVYDGEHIKSSPRIYDNDGIPRATEGGHGSLFSRKSHIDLAGLQWSLYFATLPGFRQGGEGSLSVFVLASGVALSLLLFGITWMLVRSRVQAERTSRDLEETNRALEGANRELEAFSYSVSHDLRAPLRSIDGFSRILLEDYSDELDDEGRDYLGRVRSASQRMDTLMDDLLDLSRVSRRPVRKEPVDLSAIALEVASELRKGSPQRDVELVIEAGLKAYGDGALLRVVLENLLGNSWKFTSKREGTATIEFGAERVRGERVYHVKDNGVGFDERYADKLFGAFQRLHATEEFEGSGIGLATVSRIISRHGGRVWAESSPGEGATFFFTLGTSRQSSSSPPSRKTGVA